MKNILTPVVLSDDKTKKQLKNAIERRRVILTTWTLKVEELQMELDLIQHEYNVRIGYLILKDNQLDLEIIQLRNLQTLMENGMTYDQAVRFEEDKFYNEIIEMQEKQKEIDEEKEFLEKREEVSEDVQKEIKELWKKLIRQFHPDLTTDKEEKKKREELMKSINNAYAQNDIDTLKTFHTNWFVGQQKEVSVEELENVLIEIENMISFWKEKWIYLKISEWSGWKKKIKSAKKTGEDVFADIERKLLDDIVRKIEVAKKLRKSVEEQKEK
ncbi:MAG TPA: hypothetical protein VFQ63_01380 [Patescibacteria group bacterium]|nr:hypothetical protein [Patescibacteria group bacterium]